MTRPARKNVIENTYRVLRSIVLTIVSVVGAVSILAFAAGLIFQVKPLIVVSGSMEPTIATGALMFAVQRPASTVSVGDIVTVNRPDGNGLVTHRVTAVETDGDVTTLHLKGDANTIPDPDAYSQSTVGAYLFSIPGMGYVATFFQTLRGLLVVAGIALVVIALFVFDPKKSTSVKPKTVKAGRRELPDSKIGGVDETAEIETAEIEQTEFRSHSVE
jgi:signal peptidase I